MDRRRMDAVKDGGCSAPRTAPRRQAAGWRFSGLEKRYDRLFTRGKCTIIDAVSLICPSNPARVYVSM